MGGGILAELTSVIDAVTRIAEIQEAPAARDPKDSEIMFRMARDPTLALIRLYEKKLLVRLWSVITRHSGRGRITSAMSHKATPE
jgi:hypothetical protein